MMKANSSMIVKPSISFLNSDSDAKLTTSTGNILTSMTGNASYPTPAPTLAEIMAANAAFITAIGDAINGGTALTAIKNEKRAALVALVRQLASYVQVTCNEDMAVLLSSGFPVQKSSRTPIGVLQPPSKLSVTLGARTGELSVVASSVTGAAIYNWRITAATNPEQVVQTDQTTASRTVFDNLTPGVLYNIECNVVGSAGPSNWTSPVSQMVI
jgi:hypothetical protein